jgi:hypothetical protein
VGGERGALEESPLDSADEPARSDSGIDQKSGPELLEHLSPAVLALREIAEVFVASTSALTS